MDVARTFLALAPDAALRERLAALGARLRVHFPYAALRWSVPANYHLTLVFLGRVALADIARIRVCVAPVAAALQPFRFRLGAVRAFPSARSPRVIAALPDDPAAFLAWQQFAQESPSFPIGQIINGGCTTDLSDEVIAAYDAPFPEDRYTAGARIFPTLVPTRPDDPAHDDNVAAWEVLSRFERPFLCAFSDGDPITKGGERAFLRAVPGTAGQAHTTIEGAGHFLQEDRGAELGRVLADFIAAT